MASAAALQAHLEEIQRHMPVLSFSCVPKVLSDLPAMAAAGQRTARSFNTATAAIRQCQICGCSCKPQQLGLLVSCRCDFRKSTVQATVGRFACGVCRALSSPALLLQLAAPIGSVQSSRSEALQQLLLHFAAVNAAPVHNTSSPDALVVWMQELACRAYSLQQLASSIHGWRLLGPDGQQLPSVAPAAVAKLLRSLVQQQQEQQHQHEPETGLGKPHQKKQQLQEGKLHLGDGGLRLDANVKRQSLEADPVPQLKKRKKKQQNPSSVLVDDQQQMKGQQLAKAMSGIQGESRRAAGLDADNAGVAGASRGREQIAEGHAAAHQLCSKSTGHKEKKGSKKSRSDRPLKA